MSTRATFNSAVVRAVCALSLVSSAGLAQERKDGEIQKRGFFGQSISPDEFDVIHGSEFKGAKKVAISVFNVAFPSENKYTAVTKGHAGNMSTSMEGTLNTTLKGVDQATQQRITDKAYALFVEQLKTAGYEVVDQVELARLAPEFGKWEALPNFSPGRYGAYVAPTGQSVRFLQGDVAKRDTSGFMGQQMSMFRGLDRPLAFLRSPYLAHDGGLGIIAVTLVVDYGVYSSSGRKSSFFGGVTIDFKPGATVGAGDHVDSGSLIEYWGPKSGGFPATAYLAKPVYSDLAFGTVDTAKSSVTGSKSMVSNVVADSEKFEIAADAVIAIAVPKLVGVMAAAK